MTRARNTISGVLGLALTLLSAATYSRDVSLDSWFDNELVPFVTAELSSHPRFKGETLMFVVLDDNAPTPSTNYLALSLRDRLLDAAINTSGINVGWRQGRTSPSNDHPVDCTRNNVHYYIGLELSPEHDHRYRVTVRALDLEDQSWVAGFARSWHGYLSNSQRRASMRSEVDLTFIGERDVPYTLRQVDLLANHLAQDLSCALLRQTNGEYIVPARHDAADDDDDGLIDTAIELVGKNIAALEAIELTTDDESANAELSGRAYQVDGALHQYWLTISPNGDDEALETLSASAYVVLPEDAPVARQNDEPAQPYHRTQASTTEFAHASVPIPNAGYAALLGPLRITEPTSLNRCRNNSQAMLRASARWDNEQRCSLLEADVRGDALVFLFEFQPRLGLVRLGENDCRERTSVHVVRRGNDLAIPVSWYHLASGQVREVRQWLVQPDTDTYYAVALTDARAARRIANHIDQLPLRCGASLRPGLTGQRLRDWLDDFAALAGQSSSSIDWRAIEIKNVL